MNPAAPLTNIFSILGRLWPQRHAKAQVAKHDRDRKWKKRTMLDRKAFSKLLDDLARLIQMFTFDQPAVGLPITLFENTLGRDPSRQGICHAAFARDDH